MYASAVAVIEVVDTVLKWQMIFLLQAAADEGGPCIAYKKTTGAKQLQTESALSHPNKNYYAN